MHVLLQPPRDVHALGRDPPRSPWAVHAPVHVLLLSSEDAHASVRDLLKLSGMALQRVQVLLQLPGEMHAPVRGLLLPVRHPLQLPGDAHALQHVLLQLQQTATKPRDVPCRPPER